ncbi:G protein-coupled receptor 137Ba-like [Saccostrea echinata]|uniref:G protein-coupled receptor 137Ba-like n=1 Tax=Saccostrea echinata TaxID=191078 RepID=UPI002A83398A|nr:G protein-coupled receptor 137Ba-like [Saccostrea echinata]
MSFSREPGEQLMRSHDISLNPNMGKHSKGGWVINTDDFPAVKPALAPTTQLSLTITYICLYGFLFLFVLCQLWMIWYYRHKRFSYQTCFLFTCLLWSGLRTTLFSFYFNNCIQANKLPLFLDWLFYSFPVCLQFFTLCLLVLFFGQVVFKARAKYEPSRYKIPFRLTMAVVVLIFMANNVTSAVLVSHQEKYHHSLPLYILVVRVSINGTLFLLAAIVLSACIYKMRTMSSSNVILEAKGTTLCQSMTVSILIILLYASRAIYNILAVLLFNKMPSFGYGWTNVTSQADLVDLDGGYAFLSFGIVLFIWEFLPTFVIVVFFRVRRPQTNAHLVDLSNHSQSSRQYFFDNPRRYDSDDDLSRNDLSRSINSYQPNGGSGTPTRSTPRGTPRLYGSMHSAAGSYTNKLGGFGTPPVSSIND